MDSLNMSTSYWDGNPVDMAEQSVLARKEPKQSYVENFVEKLKEKLETSQNALDATLQNISNDDLTGLNETQVENLDDIVEKEIDNIEVTTGQEAKAYKEKLKEGLKISKKSVEYIKKLKTKYEEEKKLTTELQEKANSTIETLAEVYAEFDLTKARDAQRAQFQYDNRMRMNKMVATSPPPKFDDYAGGKKAANLLAFLNEDLEEYYEDLGVYEIKEKCRMLIKIFGKECNEHKQTTRRFLLQQPIQKAIEDQTLTARVLYKELVHYIFATRPEGNIGKRKDNESLTNYLERWFTLKSYCGSRQDRQGLEVMKSIFRNTGVLNCKDEVIMELKKEFYVKQLCNKTISRAEVIGVAQRLDMLYADTKKHELHIIGAAEEHVAGMIAIDKSKDSEIDELKRKVEQLVTLNKQKLNFGNNRSQQGNQDNDQRQCYKCGETGHIRRTCPQNSRNGGQGFKNSNNFQQNKGYNGKGYQNNNYKKFNNNNYNNNNKNYNQYNNNYNKNRTQVSEISQFSEVHEGLCTFEIQINKVEFEFDNKGELREYVTTEVVAGKNEKTLLDSGASASAVSAELIAEIGQSDQIDQTRAGSVKMANNKAVPSCGRISIAIKVNGKSFTVDFVVIEGLSPSVILGAPFLDKTGVLKKFKEAIKEAGLKN